MSSRSRWSIQIAPVTIIKEHSAINRGRNDRYRWSRKVAGGKKHGFVIFPERQCKERKNLIVEGHATNFMESDPAICSSGDLSTELVAEPIGAFSVEMLILEASVGARLPARSGS